MCGYVVTRSSSKISSRTLRKMQDSIKHRGNDDKLIVYLNSDNKYSFSENNDTSEEFHTGFAFQRLSIQDLSNNARQPMLCNNQRYLIVYNGEIYNFKEIKKSLIDKGHTFKSNSDTEIVLKLYELYKEEMLYFLNGMFSFVIYDNLKDSFFIVRDRLGIKPLYYYINKNELLIASEIKSFLFYPNFIPEFNNAILNEYMMFGYQSSSQTAFQNVHECLPGHYMIFENNELKIIKYWDSSKKSNLNFEAKNVMNDLSDLVHSSINYQLISDVEVGCQLSGGIDSSLIAAIACSNSKSFKKTFSVVLENNMLNEEKYIDYVNSTFSLQENKSLLRNDEIIDTLELATWHHDLPISQPNSIGIFKLAKEAKKHLKVLLSGEGADEIFGGYDRYNAARLFTSMPRVSFYINRLRSEKMARDGNNIDNILLSLSSNSKIREIKKVFAEFDFEKAIFNRKKMLINEEGESKFQQYINYEQKTYLPDLLIRQDKMCMAHGIENRVPFLDHRIAEFSNILPTSFKTKINIIPNFMRKNNTTKYLLKEFSKKFFNSNFVYRKKLGFNMPLNEALKEKKHFEHLLSLIEESKKIAPFDIDIKSIKDINNVQINLLWSVISLGAWSKMFLRTKYNEY